MKTGRMHGWEKIVRGLKAGPDFGIHGATYQNAQSILEENQKNKASGKPYSYDCFGHRFTVNRENKNISDEEFYKCLVASVGIALKYSRCYLSLDQDKNLRFVSPPTVLVGIDNKRKSLLQVDSLPFSFMAPWIKKGDGEDVKSFGVGHDFYGGLEMIGLFLGENETEEINERWKEFSRGKDFLGENMVATFFSYRWCIERMIRKIYREVRKY